MSNGVVGSAKRTMASGNKPSAITSPNCRNSTIVNPSSNSPFDNFLLLRDRTAPADDKGFLRRSHRAGGQNACVGSEPTPIDAVRTRLPTQALVGLRNIPFPAPALVVKLLAPVPMRAAVSSDPSPTHRALAPSITCGPKRSCLSSRCGFGSVEWHQPPDRTRRIQMVDAGRRFATCEAHSP